MLLSKPSFSLFIHPRKKPFLTKMENGIAQEFKTGKTRIAYGEIFQKDTEQIKDEKCNWINNFFTDKTLYNKHIQYLLSEGYSKAESQSLLDQSIYHSLRAADWAQDNETNSGKASKWILASIPFGILKIFLNNFNSTPLFLNQIVSALSGFTAGMRGYKQFKIYGSRCDDDRAENLYAAEKYGNKASGFFADLAYLFETKINPYIRPASGFFSERIQNTIEPLLSLCNILWWRIRMPTEINQTFATDILRYVFCKPLEIFGIKKGIEGISRIDKENLTCSYINKRARNLIGLNEEKDKSVSIVSKFFKEVKSLVSKNSDEKIKASVKIGKFISPFLGLYGFFVGLIGIPLKSICSLFGKESKIINTITQTNIASQQLIYLFRLILPEHFENIRDLRKIVNSGMVPERRVPLGGKGANGAIPCELCVSSNLLREKRKRSFYTGFTACMMNVASVLLKLFNFNNNYLKIGMGIFNEIADKGISYYLSSRRALIGTKFRLDNPELFL